LHSPGAPFRVEGFSDWAVDHKLGDIELLVDKFVEETQSHHCIVFHLLREVVIFAQILGIDDA